MKVIIMQAQSRTLTLSNIYDRTFLQKWLTSENQQPFLEKKTPYTLICLSNERLVTALWQSSKQSYIKKVS